MTTTTGDPRIDGDDSIQAWIDYARPLFDPPSDAVRAEVAHLRTVLKEAGVSRWTPDLRAVLWAGFFAACRSTTVREWNTCHTVRQDYEHWVSHHNDKWAFYVAVLVAADAEAAVAAAEA